MGKFGGKNGQSLAAKEMFIPVDCVWMKKMSGSCVLFQAFLFSLSYDARTEYAPKYVPVMARPVIAFKSCWYLLVVC